MWITYHSINLVAYFLSSSSNCTILPGFTMLFRPISFIVTSIIPPKFGTLYLRRALSSLLTSSYYGTLDAVLALLNNHRQHPAWLPSHWFLGLQYLVSSQTMWVRQLLVSIMCWPTLMIWQSQQGRPVSWSSPRLLTCSLSWLSGLYRLPHYFFQLLSCYSVLL